uniref:Uncharacterized protein n=1 Tax=Candidatus Kentrum sp. TC TaxID=2126339 RepID=A0A451A3Y6_9GAMM|nr:MAG: hypothetical protein BECKTC1821F_GA0114240_104914 [Candidatus Kentron sp. TC]
MKRRNGGNEGKDLSVTEKDRGNSRSTPVSEGNRDALGEVEVSDSSEFLKDLPPDARKVIEIGMSMHRFGPMPNPLTEKLTEKHIDKILDLSAQSEDRSFKETTQSRWFTLIYASIFVVLFVFVTIFLVQADKDLYKEALKLFAIFAGGFGGGFGIKTYLDRGKEM